MADVEGKRTGGLSVRVSNTLLNLVTYWDMSTFETRLDQMREIYQTRGSCSSLEEGTMSPIFSEDPFNTPSDSWAPSPLRYVTTPPYIVRGAQSDLYYIIMQYFHP